MQGVGRENQRGPFCCAKAAFHQRQICILVTAINLVADDRVACMRQGKLGRAGSFLQEALRLHPGDTVAADNLRLVQEALAKQRPGTRP